MLHCLEYQHVNVQVYVFYLKEILAFLNIIIIIKLPISTPSISCKSPFIFNTTTDCNVDGKFSKGRQFICV